MRFCLCIFLTSCSVSAVKTAIPRSCDDPERCSTAAEMQCINMLEKADDSAFAGKILAATGGVSAFGAAPDAIPESGRWAIAASAAAIGGVGAAVIWYSEKKQNEFNEMCKVVEIDAGL